MDNSTLLIIYVIAFGLTLAVLISFFNLCINVAAIKKHLVGNKVDVILPEEMKGSVEELIKNYKYDETNLRLTPNKIQGYINAFKENGLTDQEIDKIIRKY